MKRIYLAVIGIGVLLATIARAQDHNSVKIEFEKKYEALKSYLANNPEARNKYGLPGFKCPSLDAIIAMGPNILPLLVERIKNMGGWGELHFVARITKANIASSHDNDKRLWIYPDYPDFTYRSEVYQKPGEVWKNIWVYWWENGRKRTPELFSKKYGEWKAALIEGKKEDEARVKYKAIQDLGIVALPQILEKIKGGDKELIPMFSELVDGKVAKTASANTCQEWWEKNKSFYDAVLNY